MSHCEGQWSRLRKTLVENYPKNLVSVLPFTGLSMMYKMKCLSMFSIRRLSSKQRPISFFPWGISFSSLWWNSFPVIWAFIFTEIWGLMMSIHCFFVQVDGQQGPLYLSQIVKSICLKLKNVSSLKWMANKHPCICLKLWSVFVKNWQIFHL